MAAINIKKIPSEITKFSHWILWKSVPKGNGITKIPFSVAGGQGKTNDPSTWTSFEKALSRYKAGEFSGIGFVFSKDDPFCGVDLDHCRNPETGEIEPWAWEIIKSFQSYTEISPSGSGIHIICKGQLPRGGRKRGDIEIYDRGRYFTVTGDCFDGTPQEINPAQEAINGLLSNHFTKETPPQACASYSSPGPSLDDSELIQKAIRSQNGHKFDLLYQGRWQEVGCYPSQSEADQGFCDLLAFWTGRDAARMDAIFRQSGLMRPKWDKRHYGDGRTYGQATIEKAIANCQETYKGHTGEDLLKLAENRTEPDLSPFENAKKQYPREPFPWGVLPESITKSLQQLARSCATSPTSLPGAAIAIFASTIGNTVNVYPKRSWREPLIFWCGDIRPSGEGKTPPPRALMHVLYEAQQMANEAYSLELEAWNLLSKKDRGKPPKPRGYYVTDLTLEGLRTDHSGHGGKVCVLDELSAFLTSQNQYKKKGSDRESWLCLHDGNPARIVRAKETLTLEGCRISVFGGIQPGIWQKIFSEDDGLHLIDGTIYRFLPTYEGSAFYPLTKESWSDDNRKAWERLIRSALSWADSQEEYQKLFLSEGAQNAFFGWRNDLFQTKGDLPAQIQGFIPKLVGYALRFAGIFYLMHRFCQDQEIGAVISRDYIEKGIRASLFYLGHIICAMEALVGDVSSPLELTEQIVHLARTLEGLRAEVDSGRLAVGYIQEKFNESCNPEQRIRTARGMGALIRHCNLTILGGTFNANRRRGVKCLQWDEKTNAFIKRCPPSPPSPQSEPYQGLQDADIEKPKSAMSASADVYGEEERTLRTLKNQSPQAETRASITHADIADIRDEFSEKNFIPLETPDLPEDFEDTGAFCSDCDEDVL
ncbi:MAG: DUF3987 domain-containing protein [Deltaproteobacteria bacterium]|nr:DUF3987 domain-containing protein [Deltaproteobacteria bacterium]